MRSAVNFKVRTLQMSFVYVINKHLRMYISINLESLTEIHQHFAWTKFLHKKKARYLDKLKV